VIPGQTLYLRFVEREEIFSAEYSTHTMTRTVRILQQFWEHPNGKDAAGDMFKMKMGTWRDVPVEKEA
jgi:hypothetical protein